MNHQGTLVTKINGKDYQYACLRIPKESPEAKYIDKAAAKMGMTCNAWLKYTIRQMMEKK